MSYIVPGSVILVTGASGGIGLEVAAQAAEGGAIVGVHGSRVETVDKAMEKIRARVPDARLIAAPGNFLEDGMIEQVVERVASEGGRLDAVIHCAVASSGREGPSGITGPFRSCDPKAFGEAAKNMLGTFQVLSFAALPHLAVNGGTLVTFASDSGRFAAARQSLVGAAYGGIMSFVRNLAMEVGRDKVRVHCISPSYVMDTPVFEKFAAVANRADRAKERAALGLPTPRDIAPMTLFLCSPLAEKITGQIIHINGGLNA
ncbi:MAG TPA: SDR family oxidoreductase [Novosphingobium sp.]|nr:SDR family oxidoreductase [Novosphingobium sp.]